MRSILAVEEWRKNSWTKKWGKNLLLEELVSIVNKRDELVHHLDTQERAIEDDDEIERNLSRAGLAQRNKNCMLNNSMGSTSSTGWTRSKRINYALLFSPI